MHVWRALGAIQRSVHSTGIPVIGCPGDVLGRRMVRVEQELRPFYHVILIVVEYEDLSVRMRFGEGGTEVIGDEFTLSRSVV